MKTAVIVGAGPAGLTTAYELAEKGNKDWKVIVLEESPYIGGISRTAVHGDCRIDIGGHRFFSKSKEVNDLWAKLMPVQGSPSKDDLLLDRTCHTEHGGPDPEKTDRVMLRRHRVSRIYYLRHFCDIDEDDILREMSRQWPLAWRYWNAMPVGGFRILREAPLPMFRDWVVGETAPHDDRCWTKLSYEQQMKEFPNVATKYRGPEESAVLLDYLNRIRDICQRNDLRLVILSAPLPSNNPQRTFPFLDEWKGILADQGFEVLDCRTVCPDEDFRDSHHLAWWGRERFTDKMLKELGLKGNGDNCNRSVRGMRDTRADYSNDLNTRAILYGRICGKGMKE